MKDAQLIPGFRNCHAHGLDSIVLSRYDDGRPKCRMFVAHKHHALWRNGSNYGMSIAFHGHRANIALELIKGKVWNVECIPAKEDEGNYRPFIFESYIVGEKGGFRAIKGPGMSLGIQVPLGSQKLELKGSVYHSIRVDGGQKAAWLVHEGELDPNYNPTVYSNVDLTKFDAKDMYVPMTQAECDSILANL